MSRTTRSSTKRDFVPESSWRMVEGGENDSFDTSILHDEDDIFISSSSDPASQPTGSQSFSIGGSQPWSIGGSQDDNIETFLSKAEEDEQLLLRTPFRPSIPKSVRQISRDDMRVRPSEPEFYMPRVDVESPRRPSTWSSGTVRASDPPPTPPKLRRRRGEATGSPVKGRHSEGSETQDSEEPTSFSGRLSASLPDALFDALSWACGLAALAFRYAQTPLAILLSLYIAFGGVIVLHNLATRPLFTALTPVCRIPGVSWLDLPFCPDHGLKRGDTQERQGSVKFDSLMDVQEQLGQVVEKSVQGVPLPIEIKRSETSIRDLRTLVRYSTVQSKEELLLEFDGFIDTIGTVSRDLQKFNARTGSAIDWVISMNRWTSRHLDSLEGSKSSDGDHGAGILNGPWVNRLFSPFQPAVFTERQLVDTYIEHATLVSDKISKLIEEAQGVLHTLSKAGEHMDAIYDFVARTERSVRVRRAEVLSTLWGLVGGHRSKVANLNSQLTLLKQVDAQRSDAVRQVTDLIGDLEKIQAGLDDLRERVATPALARGRVEVPMSVHIDTINRGVERLEEARSRIRAIENDRIQEVLARGKGQKMIEQA
ncbi:hypothetical protein N657DRAFT_638528 [Parathielavia appendiculata]|uniref:Uncharacterized protein n=1 Tax=Parathielavia appendiculata TaxID=2587402 RepID=A0AAN6Z721_9PEZI|nr:hypothetical protein N657DRAFT_638528 [Parathielavia appendiculata]